MKVRSWMGSFAVVALCTASSAFAAIDASRVGKQVKFEETRTEVGLDARVGVGSLTGDMADVSVPGGLLGLVAVAQPWRNLGLEGNIEAQRLPLEDSRVGDEQSLYRYNTGLLIKAGPLVLKDKLRPFLGAGAGLSYVNVTDGADGIYDNDVFAELPLAAGVDFKITPSISAGARASYQFLIGDSFADDAITSEENPDGNLLNFGLTVGGRF